MNNRVIVIENKQSIFQLRLQLQQNRVINYNFVNYNYNFSEPDPDRKVLDQLAPCCEYIFASVS